MRNARAQVATRRALVFLMVASSHTVTHRIPEYLERRQTGAGESSWGERPVEPLTLGSRRSGMVGSMPSLSLDVDSNSYQSGSTTGTCPHCSQQTALERWTKSKSFRFFGIPVPFKSTKETLKCTMCGKSHKPA